MKICRPTILCAAVMFMACLFGIVAAKAQGPPSMPGVQMADQVFKSITVLKGISVDEFMDTMGFFSASLGWNCTDCHGDDAVEDWANFAKDTPRKTMARKMILMVKFINQTQFGSTRRVTCYTCHRGDAQPKITPSLADQYGTPPPEDPDELEIADRPATAGTPSADQVLDKYVQSLGGAQRLTALHSIVAQGTYQATIQITKK